MGFDLSTLRFRDKDTAPYDRGVVEAIFNRDALNPTTPLTTVEYENGRAEIYGADKDQVDGIMLSHFGGRTVMERVFELADTTGSLLLWPAEEPAMAVTNRSVLEHLPDDIIALGTISVVTTVDELIDLIFGS